MKLKHFSIAATFCASLACNGEITGLEPPSDPAADTFAPALNVNLPQMTKLPSGVYYRDSIVGTGDEVVTTTDTIWVTYAGYLTDGKLFDSGTNAKFQPIFLVPGFRAGMLGMKVGGRRRLVIPSEQGYGGVSIKGPDGKIKIPRQSTLIFDIDLLKLNTPKPATP